MTVTADTCLYRGATSYRRPGAASAGTRLAPAWSDDLCAGKQLHANYANPYDADCGSYISCDFAGIARVVSCPSGMQYTEDVRPWGHCDYPHLAKCHDGDD